MTIIHVNFTMTIIKTFGITLIQISIKRKMYERFDLTGFFVTLRLKNILHESQTTAPKCECKAGAPHTLHSFHTRHLFHN